MKKQKEVLDNCSLINYNISKKLCEVICIIK